MQRASSAIPSRRGLAGLVEDSVKRAFATFLIAAALAAAPARAQQGDEAAELAKKLANPVASLISVPFQNNWDFGLGPEDDGWKWTMNVQPVIPVSIAKKWNLISRTILPITYQDDVLPDSDQWGLGDTTQSLFLSPKEPWPFGIVWGLGPAALLPTGTRELLSAEKWGMGPTAVVLKQIEGWTVGALTNHIWSFAGDGDRDDVNSTFLQPFVNYTTKRGTSFLVNTESTYDWEHQEWTVPINAGVLQVLKIGSQRIQVGLQGRYWAETPAGGADWGFRLPIVLLFPK